jgi:hypothetical protein
MINTRPSANYTPPLRSERQPMILSPSHISTGGSSVSGRSGTDATAIGQFQRGHQNWAVRPTWKGQTGGTAHSGTPGNFYDTGKRGPPFGAFPICKGVFPFFPPPGASPFFFNPLFKKALPPPKEKKNGVPRHPPWFFLVPPPGPGFFFFPPPQQKKKGALFLPPRGGNWGPPFFWGAKKKKILFKGEKGGPAVYIFFRKNPKKERGGDVKN